MKIVPVTTCQGMMFKVVKRGIFGRQYLADHGRWVNDTEALFTAASPPLMHLSVDGAVDEIKKQFGETAKIKYWEGS